MSTRSVLLTDAAIAELVSKGIRDPKEIRKFRENPKNTRLRENASADSEGFTSKCCNMFTEYFEGKYICTGCGRNIKNLESGERFKHSETTNSSQNAINSDLTLQLTWNLQRIANDPTYDLTTVVCSYCGNFTRFTRDLNDEGKYVCIGCRDVGINIDDVVVDDKKKKSEKK